MTYIAAPHQGVIKMFGFTHSIHTFTLSILNIQYSMAWMDKAPMLLSACRGNGFELRPTSLHQVLISLLPSMVSLVSCLE